MKIFPHTKQVFFPQVIVTGEKLYGVPSVSMGAAQMLLPHGQLLNVAKSSGHYLDYI